MLAQRIVDFLLQSQELLNAGFPFSSFSTETMVSLSSFGHELLLFTVKRTEITRSSRTTSTYGAAVRETTPFLVLMLLLLALINVLFWARALCAADGAVKRDVSLIGS